MRKGFTMLELMIVVAVISTVSAISIPGLLAAQRSSHERDAATALRAIALAEIDFRTNDRDNNQVADYWTADLFALYALRPVVTGLTTVPGDTTDPALAIRLIEPSLAGADALSQSNLYGNVTVAASIGRGAPKAGYLFRAFTNQHYSTIQPLKTNTDGASYYGNVHHASRFAFLAFPVNRALGGRLFMVNADRAIFTYDLPTTYAATYSPMTAAANSNSTVTGTGLTLLNNATTFPRVSTIGLKRLD